MNRSAKMWAAVMLVGGLWLLYRAVTMDAGTVWVRDVPVTPEGSNITWTKVVEVDPKDRKEPGVHLSVARTAGLWLAALSTLAVLSFLWGDNPAYRLVEAVVVGTSAGYSLLVGVWETLVPNLFAKLWPGMMAKSLMPGLGSATESEPLFYVPLVLGAMMLCRLLPKGGWISRWPMAFFIGATAGLRLVANLEADFVRQIQSTVIPLFVASDGKPDWAMSLRNTAIVLGTLACLTYFFFSVEHKGVAGGVSRVGVCFLMITFGAGFANTVMSRISLIGARLEFLFVDWLWLVDPTNRLGR